MKKTEIGRWVHDIDDKIEELKAKKKRLQKRCKHTQVEKTLISNYCYKEPLEKLEEYYSVRCLNCKLIFKEEKSRR